MNRATVQTWLIAASAVAVHAIMVVAMLLVRERYPDPSVVEVPAPFTLSLVEPAEPEPLVELPPPVELEALGELTGSGDSIAKVELPDEMRSPRPMDFEQAWTRREPIVAPPPAPAIEEQASAAEEVEVNHIAEELAAQPERSRETLPFGTVPTPAPSTPPTPEPALAEQTPASPEPEPIAAATAQPAATATPAPDAPADPAPAGPSDLDAFAKEEGIDFAPGGVQARQGREVKIARPRIDLGFMADATRLQDIVVKLHIATDPTGRPRYVDVRQSSGSDAIDDAVRLAVYESWFGEPMPDEFPFTVRFLK